MKMNSIYDLLLPYQKSFFTNKKKRKIFLASRQIGKSFVAAVILCYKALSKKFGTSLCVSVNQNSASEIIAKCRQVAEAIKLLTNNKVTYQSSFDKIVFSNGSRVISLSSNPQAMRGYSTTCVVVDEAAFVPNLDEVMQSISPTLSRDQNAELILLTTPAGKNGHFFKMYEKALRHPDTWYVQTTTIYDAIEDGLKVDIDSLRSLCPDDNVFAQEYCCEFANSNIALINTDLLKTYNENDSKFVEYFIGVDFGRTNDFTAICVLGRDIDSRCYVVDMTVLKNTEFKLQLDAIKAKFNQYNPKALYCDAGGLGKPLAEDLELHFNKRCKGFTFNQNNKHEAYIYFKKVVNANELFIKKEYLSDIVTDVQSITQVINENGKVSYLVRRGKDNGHNDRLSALVLALQASHDNIFSLNLPVAYRPISRF